MSPADGNGFMLALPPELVEELAVRIAECVVAQLPPKSEPYLTTEQAAGYLACKPKRIHELTESDKLPCLRDGKRKLFRRSDLDAYLEAGP